ncbi:MAG: hypothetical protein RMY28_002150 [Nostoc sp. ChiSLP01]
MDEIIYNNLDLRCLVWSLVSGRFYDGLSHTNVGKIVGKEFFKQWEDKEENNNS